jgi:putative hydrolase of the HAD superfamily
MTSAATHSKADSGPRWVVFDAVGTLIFPALPIADVYFRVGRSHGSTRLTAQIAQSFRRVFEDDDRADLLEQTSGQWRCRPTSESRERERWRSIVGRVLDDVEGDACFDELFRYFGCSEAWKCFDDVQPCLDGLAARGASVAVASNFDARLDTICAELQPLRGLSPILVSSRMGFRKPDVRFFQQVLTALDCGPDEILFVGDDLRNDVEAARSAGIAAVQIDRAARVTRRDVVTHLGKIVDWWQEPGCGPGETERKHRSS